jgi:hypothetical protein
MGQCHQCLRCHEQKECWAYDEVALNGEAGILKPLLRQFNEGICHKISDILDARSREASISLSFDRHLTLLDIKSQIQNILRPQAILVYDRRDSDLADVFADDTFRAEERIGTSIGFVAKFGGHKELHPGFECCICQLRL